MTLLRVDSSIRTDGSVTRDLLDVVERAALGAAADVAADVAVVRRDLSAAPVLSGAWELAVPTTLLPEGRWAPAMRDARALAERVADELIRADAVAVGAPMYNFGVPTAVKSWIDLLIVDPRFRPGVRPLAGRPLVLVVATGGGYGPGTPNAGWDHATPYLLRIFGDVFGADVTLVTAELTAAETDPRMAKLRPLAGRSRAAARTAAEAAGAELGRRLAARVPA